MADSTPNFDIYFPEQTDVMDNLPPHFGMLAQSVDDAMTVNNTDIQEYINSLFGSSAVSATRPSSWNIPGTERVTIPFTATSNVRGANPPVLSNNALTIYDSGLYLITIRLVFGNITSGWRDAHIMINGETSEIGAINSIADGGAGTRRINSTFPVELYQGDRVGLATQGLTANSGQFLNSNNLLRATRIGPINIGV